MKKRITSLSLMFLSFLFLTSCASMLNGKNQKVNIHTNSTEAKVYVDDELQGAGEIVISKMRRDAQIKQIRIDKEGYKPIYKIHYQDRKSPLHIISWVPFGILFYPPLVDFGPKAFNYPKDLHVEEEMLKINERQDGEKYVFLKNTAFDIKKEDMKFTVIKHRQLKKNKENYKEKGSSETDVKFDNSIFSDAVQDLLTTYNYTDTSNTIFKNNTNTLYVSAKITKVNFDNVYSFSAKNYMYFLITKIDIEWEIFDLYHQSKYKQIFNAKSGEFAIRKGENDVAKNSIQDAITESFFKFMNTEQVQQLIKDNTIKSIKLESLKIDKPQVITNIEEATEATVTVKTKEGHGSGCVISNDGYIVTNFHVVSNADEITIITKKGKEIPAKIIRKNEFSDLALLKAEEAFKHSFTLPTTKNYRIGDDIFVIGTPKSVELGQSLSKGIVSGFRQNEDVNLIQTDASVNQGNSGGAMINKEGAFIGVVNAKLFGVGIEGLGFCIPAEKVLTDLFITYE